MSFPYLIWETGWNDGRENFLFLSPIPWWINVGSARFQVTFLSHYMQNWRLLLTLCQLKLPKSVRELLEHCLRIFCQSDMANFSGCVSRKSLSLILFPEPSVFIVLVKMACLLFSCLQLNNSSFYCSGIHKNGALETICVTSIDSLSKLTKFF